MKTEKIKRVRTTISVTPEAHEIFKRMASASNMSVSMAMGEWLTDTADAAQMIVLKMEEAKKAPMRVMREMQAMVAGMASGINEDFATLREKKKVQCHEAENSHTDSGLTQGMGDRGSFGFGDLLPPSSNTGVLVPQKPNKSSKSVAKNLIKKVSNG